jgi:hypothetical protein
MSFTSSISFVPLDKAEFNILRYVIHIMEEIWKVIVQLPKAETSHDSLTEKS